MNKTLLKIIAMHDLKFIYMKETLSVRLIVLINQVSSTHILIRVSSGYGYLGQSKVKGTHMSSGYGYLGQSYNIGINNWLFSSIIHVWDAVERCNGS